MPAKGLQVTKFKGSVKMSIVIYFRLRTLVKCAIVNVIKSVIMFKQQEKGKRLYIYYCKTVDPLK